MKRICFLAVLVFSIYSTNSNAQTLGKLYGLLSRGGDSAGGVMFNYDAQHSKDTVVKSFYPGIMGVAYNNLVQATDGDFYGMTEGGGADGVGTIFKCSASGKVTLLHTFTDYPDGAYAFASLIQANDGNLYGMTEGGGANGYGCIFKCTTTGTFSIIYSFNTGITGANPYGSLIQATDGKLYGMTSAGGTSNNGNVFSCTLAGVYTDLADFNSTNGNTPYGNLIQAKDGNLYGMTKNGGVNNLGVIFQCTTTGTLTKLVDFTGTTNGSTPYGSLVQAADNNLYGMTSAGGANSYGVIFQCTTSGTLTKLVDFDYTTNGATPYGNLMQATDGNLYGMASTGGTYGSGILFQCTTIGTLTPVVNYSNYESPYGSLIQATDGNLYGMTVSGGTAESGTIFKCTTGGTNVVLYNMGVNTFGSTPNGSPNQGSDGSIYGMTSQGGSIGYGTIFKTDTLGVTKVIFNFDSTNGSNPYGSLIMAKDGFLYGMTDRGGATNVGVIFKCSSAGVLTKLVDFNITNGETPFGHLIEGTDGNLYGMTENGGTIGYGVIFKCTTAGVITVLYNFDGTNGGQYPYGSLIQAKDGNLYGMTESGGASNAGTIFQCTTSGTFTKLYDFNGTTDGANAQGSLVQATDGNLYGMTWSGGANSFGTIFKCTTTGTFTKLMDFSSTTGGSLYGSFIQATDSNLYAVTQSGATYGDGGIIKYTLAGQFSRVYDFDGSKGYGPQYSDLLEAMSTSISVGTPGCTNRTITANVQGGGIGTYSYSWSTGASTSSISVPNTAIGYTVTVKGANGVTRSSTISLPAYIPLTATAGVVAEPKCNGDANGSVSVTAFNGTAGYTYLWNNGQTTTTVSGLTAGIYTVIVTDANSCTATVKDTLKDPDLLTANITSSVNPTCHGFSNGSAIITAGGGTGAYSYLWNNVSGTTTSTLNGVGGGTYSVTVTDANNCTAITSVTLTSPAAINITVTDKNPLCSGSNGSASINANGGTPGYIFSWSNGATTSSISNISAGSYSVIITDSHSCTDTVKLTLTTTTPVTITTATVTNVSCPTCADGSAKVTITGGSNNTIEWKDSTATGYVVMANHTSDTISKLTSGTYVCVVTDSCGSKTDTIRLKKSTVGIQTINANDEITVYPVPTSGLVSFTAEGVECKLLTIYDETGKQIYTHVLDARNANSIITVDMSVYANGIYFAQIITSNGVANKKIKIQK